MVERRIGLVVETVANEQLVALITRHRRQINTLHLVASITQQYEVGIVAGYRLELDILKIW